MKLEDIAEDDLVKELKRRAAEKEQQKKSKVSSLEEEFKKAYVDAEKLMEQHLIEARVAIRKAINVSEEYGIAFEGNISFLHNRYTPNSFDKKWGSLDRGFLEEFDTYQGDDPGWHHSTC